MKKEKKLFQLNVEIMQLRRQVMALTDETQKLQKENKQKDDQITSLHNRLIQKHFLEARQAGCYK